MTGTPIKFIKQSFKDGRLTGSIEIIGPEDDVKNIESVIKKAFTKEELTVMCKHEGVEVFVGKIYGNKPGAYARKQDGIPVPMIRIAENARDDQIVHEFIHHLRAIDDRRMGIARTSYPVGPDGELAESEEYFRNITDIKNIEEAATTLETTARRFSKADQSGYYSKIFGKDPRQAYEFDRRLMTGSRDVHRSVDLRGDEAVNAVNDKFERSMMAYARIYPEELIGKVAVDSWNALIDLGFINK